MKACVVLAFFVALTAIPLRADVKMPSIFSDHMVLQKAARVPIWGKAAPGEEIEIKFDTLTVKTKADEFGKWSVALDLGNSTAGPFTLTVTGNNTLTLNDVLVGQVWFAAGQSNMEFVLKNASDGDKEVAAASNPMLRQFLVSRTAPDQPLDDCRGQWMVLSPETAGQFSAVGYYFIKTLQSKVQEPFAIVLAAFGGTPVEAWTSADALRNNPELGPACERYWRLKASYPANRAKFEEDFTAWSQETNRNAIAMSSTPATSVKLPTKLSACGLASFQKEFDVPVDFAAEQRVLEIPAFYGEVRSVAINGKDLKLLDPKQAGIKQIGLPIRFLVPAGTLAAGKNAIALEIFGPAAETELRTFRIGPINFPGEWKVIWQQILPVPDKEKPLPPALPEGVQAASLFNGMVHPVIPYAITGAIWYQGESNADHAAQYHQAFPSMISDWRAHWQQGDFPFYFVQLANFTEKRTIAGEEDAWAELREAQSMALKLPSTGQAVIIDVGEARDLHPRDKKTVGQRLAAIALAKDYKKKIPFSGPVYAGMKIEGGKIRLNFDHVEGGLVAQPLPETYVVRSLANETAPLQRNSPDSELEGFIVSGTDKKWFWADAKIDGDSVVVWSDKVPAPAAVRYAWGRNPTCNLYDNAGFPASPFRTDDYPGVTEGKKF
jgi:sialate O-acetylesterase